MYRTTLKATLGHALWPSLTTRIARHFRNGRGLILTFHYIGDTPLPGVLDSLFLPEDEFAKILDFIAGELEPLPPLQFVRHLSENTLPPRATLITFDDCTRETVMAAGRELQKRDLAAFWFACPGLIDAGTTIPSLDLLQCCMEAQPGAYTIEFDERAIELTISDLKSRALAHKKLWPLLFQTASRLQVGFLQTLRNALGLSRTSSWFQLANWDELRVLSGCGMYIGNHTYLHSTVVADGIEQFKCDLETAYTRLQSEVPQSHRIFCYPYGRRIDATRSTRDCLKHLNTEYAFVTQGGIASKQDGDYLNLRREDASYSLEATKLAPVLALVRSLRADSS